MPTEGQPALPSLFGRYTLIQRLAIGGMAEVFRAKITSSHGFEKVLVIKRILPHLAADKTFVAMFIDEAKLTAQLTHPKIVQIMDFGSVAGQYFIALEFVDGCDALALLRTCAQRKIRMPLAVAAFITMEVLDALDYAHNARDIDGRAMQIVHRDISPSNVFISRRGDVKLGDFGIAHAQERESKTQAGTLKGKYGYMSPEQVVGGGLDGRSDLFAVGIVLAEMFMGRRLFTAPNDLDVLLMVRDARIERLDKYAHDLPPELDAIVRRALRRDPNERFQSAADFRDALADYLFASGRRVGTAELRTFVADLFDPSPEALTRLMRQARGVAHAASGAAAKLPMPVAAAAVAAPAGLARPAALEQAPIAVVAPAEPIGERVVRLEATADAAATAALGNALAQPLAVVDLDQWSGEPAPGLERATGWTPVSRVGSGALAAEGRARGGSTGTRTDFGRFVSGAPRRPPDMAGDVSVVSPMRVFADLAIATETGLLRLDLQPGVTKEIYLVAGAPESVSSSLANERFGEYLVSKGVLRAQDLEQALAMLPQYAGKLGDTLVGLGLLKPLDVFRLLSQQVRDRVIEIFGWTQGTFAFFRGVTNEQESFPLGLDTFEILGAGILNLRYETLDQRFSGMRELTPMATGRVRVTPEAFRLGPTPRQVLDMLDGRRTLRTWMAHFTDPAELLTFLRSLYLLIETDLAEFQ